MDKANIIGASVSMLIGIVIIYFSINLFINLNNKMIPLCHDLQDLGYSSYQDIATHEDCRILEDTNYGFKNLYDVYDDECRLSKPRLGEYGLNCVWVGLGYFKLLGTMMLFMFGLGILGVGIAVFFSKENESKLKKSNTQEERNTKLEGGKKKK